jgi:hypothetical protein
MGTWAHSEFRFYSQLVVFAIDDPSVLRMSQVHAWLADRDLWHKRLAGVYTMKDGTRCEEPALVMEHHDFNRVMRDSAWVIGQEAFLRLGMGTRQYYDVGRGRSRYTTSCEGREAIMEDVRSGVGTPCGFFHSTTRDYALPRDHTLDLATGNYFVIT